MKWKRGEIIGQEKYFLQGRRKTEKEIRKTQKGKDTEGNILKGGKYLEKENFLRI